ncbi:hypothetical protein K3152_01645 [Qipengyuania sp. 1NDH17]|uniref:DUF2975 domain-containing protein n=1 Tax=Qipengyuania polymorpha TaxID=2867234 RepID=A0ABS7J0I6_9SPHN|nr:hypothetical protein [Qipengyuania polymorpha]MBX7456938.1 hypothetical protein [Qipengyuania polymorpha]
MRNLLTCYRWPLVTFILTLLVGYAARSAIGRVYSAAEAVDLLNALSRAGLYLGSAIATASATIIALMLTLVGMIRRMDEDFDHGAYRDVAMVGRLSAMTLLVSLFLLMAFALPIGEFEELPSEWFANVYNGLFAGTVVMVGLSAATVVLIYTTLLRVMAKITPGGEV